MTRQQKFSKTMCIALWIAQVLLAAILFWGSFLKFTKSSEALAAMWPWTAQVPLMLVKFTAFVDFLGAWGLIVALAIRKPSLGVFAALGIMSLMITAGAFHILRGEAAQIWINVILVLVAAFVAWGWWKRT